jgi:cell wall-associated NlpC family hydrolase
MITRQDIVEEAKTWLRTPWMHRQRVKGCGVDCAQLLIGVFSGVGMIKEFDTGEYPSDWMMHRSEERFQGFVRQYAKQVDKPLPGDIVLYKVGHCFAHGAIVVEWPLIIHAFLREGSVVYGEGDNGWLSTRDRLYFSVVDNGLSV